MVVMSMEERAVGQPGQQAGNAVQRDGGAAHAVILANCGNASQSCRGF
jgi:hypothetical protein